MGTVIPESKQGNTTNLGISFSMENDKRAAYVGFEYTTYGRRQKKVPPFDPYNGCPFKKPGRHVCHACCFFHVFGYSRPSKSKQVSYVQYIPDKP